MNTVPGMMSNEPDLHRGLPSSHEKRPPIGPCASHGTLTGHAKACASRRDVLRLCGALALTGLGAREARASAYPDKPIRIIVPFSAGGATDILGRMIGQAMEKTLKQPMVVENRVGAAGAIGAAVVAKAEADGYSVLFGGVGTNIVLAYTQPSLPYDPVRDLIPVVNLCNVDYVLAVSATSEFHTLADLISAARKRPRNVSYMSTGPLGPLHLALEYLSKQANVQMVHVPYKGESAALPDLIEGRVDVAMMTVPFVKPLVHDGRLRVLATISGQRAAGMPEVPTVAEQGFPGYAVPIWNGLFVPTHTPPDRIAALNAAAMAALAEPGLRNRMIELGVTPTGSTPTAYAAFLTSERERWLKMIQDTGVLNN